MAGNNTKDTNHARSQKVKFKELIKKMPGGKLSDDGKSYEVDGNTFNESGSLVAKNGNKGSWEAADVDNNEMDAGDFKMIIGTANSTHGDERGYGNDPLTALNKANKQYATRRTKEIKIEKKNAEEDAALDAITGVKGSGAAVRKKTEGAGSRSNFLEASKSTNVAENISNVSPKNINGKKEEDDKYAGYRNTGNSSYNETDFNPITDGSILGQNEGTYSSTNGAQKQAKRDLENLSATTGVSFSALANMDKDKVEALKAKVAEIDAVKLKMDEAKKKIESSSSRSSSSSSYGGSSRRNTSNNNPINIQDLPEEITGTDETTTGVVEKTESREDIERRIQDNKDLLNNLGNRPKFVHDYAPDQQKNTNLVDNITDAGRIAMGGIAANTEIPVYERGSMFQTSMDELSDRRNIGLSDTEKDFARNMAERGYGYDVKNIGKFAGGSAGVALGNLGRATGQLYDEYGKIAVRDEGVRRQNRSDFNRGALADEQVNRQIFTDDLNQKMMTKQAGAALVQDATKNMRDRAQYEKAYGKGSQMYEYMKTLDRDKKESMFDQEQANADRVEDSIKTSERAIEDDEKLLQGLGGLTQGTTLGGEAGAMEGLKTVAELEDAYAKGDIDDFTYQSKLQQQPEGTTMPDNYEFPSAANPTGNSNPQTVRNVTNDPTVRNDYGEGLVGDFKKSESGIVNNIENETTETPDLATPGIVDNETEEVTDVATDVATDEIVTEETTAINETVTEDDMIEAKANGVDLIDTESLSGGELDKAEMENRLRVAENKSKNKFESEPESKEVRIQNYNDNNYKNYEEAVLYDMNVREDGPLTKEEKMSREEWDKATKIDSYANRDDSGDYMDLNDAMINYYDIAEDTYIKSEAQFGHEDYGTDRIGKTEYGKTLDEVYDALIASDYEYKGKNKTKLTKEKLGGVIEAMNAYNNGDKDAFKKLKNSENKTESGEFNPAEFSDIEGKVSRENQTPEDKMADYEKELSGNPETLAKYKEDPIAFLEDDIKGWESEPDSEKKTESLKNLKENLDILKSDNVSPEEREEWQIRGYEDKETFEKERSEAEDENINRWDMYEVDNNGLNETTRENISKEINNQDFSVFQSVMEDEIGRVGEDGKVVATPHTKEEIAAYDSDGDIEGAGEMRGGYGPKQGIKKLFPELKKNEELMNSPQAEMLRMWNVNKGFNPKVIAALSQGLIKSEDRGAYHSGKKDINDVKGIDVAKVDPETLLYELADAYKNTYGFGEDSKSGKLPKNYNAYAERIVTMAKRHNLRVPKGLMEK